ncbi:MAG: hypothetical protein RL329_914 [Bacteroidota bacterium]
MKKWGAMQHFALYFKKITRLYADRPFFYTTISRPFRIFSKIKNNNLFFPNFQETIVPQVSLMLRSSILEGKYNFVF